MGLKKMKATVNSNGKTIVYEESFWTGKKTIIINGTECTKVNKTVYKYNDTEVKLIGNFLTGAKLDMNGEVVVLIDKPSALEIILSSLILLFFLVWGNSVTLVKIIPLAGGAIGGAIGGGGLVVNIAVIREHKSVGMKCLMTLAVFAACAAINFILTALILGAL